MRELPRSGKAHVEARGGKATIIAFSELSPEACARQLPALPFRNDLAREHPAIRAHTERHGVQQLPLHS